MSATAAAQTLPHRPDTERPAMTAQTTDHSPARIDPDTVAVLVLVLLGIAALIAASAALSFDGLTAIAAWAGVRAERAWLVPVFIEGAILVYTGAAIIHQARHEDRRARRAWAWVRLWTLVSSAANGAHAWDAGPGGWQGFVGVAIAALIPLGVYVAVHMAAGLIVEPTALEPATAAAASAAGADGPADVRTDSGTGGQAGSERTGATPDPLVVLEEIETAPRADTDTGQADGQRTAGRADSGHLAGRTDVGAGASGVRAEQPALELAPDTVRTGEHVYDQSADTTADAQTDGAVDTSVGQADRRDDGQRSDADAGRTASVRERRASASVEAVRPQIEELARQGLSGREIAGRLGVGRTRACEIVRDLREAGALVA